MDCLVEMQLGEAAERPGDLLLGEQRLQLVAQAESGPKRKPTRSASISSSTRCVTKAVIAGQNIS